MDFIMGAFTRRETGTAFTEIRTYLAFCQTLPPQDINLDNIAPPAGVYVNAWAKVSSQIHTDVNLLDENTNASGIAISFNEEWLSDSKAFIAYTDTPMFDYQLVNTWVSTTTKTFTIKLPEGTFNLKASAASGQVQTTRYTFAGMSRDIAMMHPQTEVAEWNNFIVPSGGGTYSFSMSRVSGDHCRIGGLDIIQIA